jgi:DNA-binding transcriptional ArsR family regulator
MGEEALQVVLRFFRALADASRLRMLGVLAGRECSVDELAGLVGLSHPTVSHHLSKLKELGLVRMRADGTTHLYSLDEVALRRLSKDVLTPEGIVSLADDVEGDEWERKVLRDFLDGERLKQIPAPLKKKMVILRWLAKRFEPGRQYPEREVNEIIKRHHPDTSELRRAMIDHRLMRRDRGVYWRHPETLPQ